MRNEHIYCNGGYCRQSGKHRRQSSGAGQKGRSVRWVMDGFTHSTATVEQRQEYAECVGLLYPSADVISPPAVGLLLITVLLGAIFGARYGRGEGMAMMAIAGVLGAMTFPLVLTVGWGIWQAIKYALGVTG